MDINEFLWDDFLEKSNLFTYIFITVGWEMSYIMITKEFFII